MAKNNWLGTDDTEVSGVVTVDSNLEPIPDGTRVLAFIDEAKWDYLDDENEDYIKLKWKVLKPEEYKNRVIFQKVRVEVDDDTKAKKHRKMLANISFNAGAGIHQATSKPEDKDLQKELCNKPMVLTLRVWEQGEASGNWVAGVSPRKNGTPNIVVHDERTAEEKAEQPLNDEEETTDTVAPTVKAKNTLNVGGAGRGRPKKNNIPEIDIDEDNIPF